MLGSVVYPSRALLSSVDALAAMLSRLNLLKFMLEHCIILTFWRRTLYNILIDDENIVKSRQKANPLKYKQEYCATLTVARST